MKDCSEICGSPSLYKACEDPFDYVLKLKTGEVIKFEQAEVVNDDWIRLITHKRGGEVWNGLPYPAPRGVDVRISEIVWVMDAPEGS